jgi:hypothetical protein
MEEKGELSHYYFAQYHYPWHLDIILARIEK